MSETPWQLQMFHRSLKKQLKMKALLKFVDQELNGARCLDVTHGDNTGSMDYYFRERGGTWVSADMEDKNLQSMKSLLVDSVMQLELDHWSFPDDTFDLIVVIDVLEHVENPDAVLAELKRVVKPDGRVLVTVPNGDPRLIINKIRNLIGMTPEKYGHVRAGFTLKELSDLLQGAGFNVHRTGGYSKIFTEMVELVINAMYVLSFNKDNEETYGSIAPTSQGELKTHGLSYKLYSAAFPVLNLFSKLDYLAVLGDHHAVIVEGSKS